MTDTGEAPGPSAEELTRRYERLLEENFTLREKVRNLEEDIEALHWDIKLRRMRSPWRELPAVGRRVKRIIGRGDDPNI